MSNATKIDWYARRDELEGGMVFKTHDGVVRLDRGVPGDGSKWYVQDWSNGWFCHDSTLEPGELIERLPDNFSGEVSL